MTRPVVHYKIEKSIPQPVLGRERLATYPLREMEVGDSFVVPFAKMSAARNAVTSFVWYKKQQIKGKDKSGAPRFSTRTVIEKGKKCLRIWRDA